MSVCLSCLCVNHKSVRVHYHCQVKYICWHVCQCSCLISRYMWIYTYVCVCECVCGWVSEISHWNRSTLAEWVVPSTWALSGDVCFAASCFSVGVLCSKTLYWTLLGFFHFYVIRFEKQTDNILDCVCVFARMRACVCAYAPTNISMTPQSGFLNIGMWVPEVISPKNWSLTLSIVID
jgi:hypothetical protein